MTKGHAEVSGVMETVCATMWWWLHDCIRLSKLTELGT